MTLKSPLIDLADGHKIPQLGFGLYKTKAGEVDTAINAALEAGYRHFDTAEMYDNEAEIGATLQKANLPREELFITTKLWNDKHDFNRAIKAIDSSLKKLQLDYVDLYLIHWPEPANGKYLETWDALVEIKKSGKAKSIGVSNFTQKTLATLKEHSSEKPVINQIELHPYFNQAAMRKINQEYGIVTEAWSPLGRGTELNDPTIAEIAEKYNMTPAQVILCWQLQLGNVVIPKSVTPSRIKSNFESLNYHLEPEYIEKINSLTKPDGRMGADPDLGIAAKQ